MTHLHRLFPAFLFLLVAFQSRTVFAQDEQIESLSVFLDCQRSCDFDYIRREIPYVDYVRDWTQADVHLLVTSERTGSGGQAYILNFIGLEQFRTLTDTLRYSSSSTDTRDETRIGLTKKIESGLYRYVARTSIADRLDIRVTGHVEGPVETSNPEDDPWNSWVFSVGMDGSYSAEESNNFTRLRGNFNANRVTEDWKFRFNFRANYSESNFDLGDGGNFKSTTEDGNIWAFLVKSISDHWSVGGSFFVNTSTRQNRKLYGSVSPAVEFNVFPYSESNRREIRVIYQLSLQSVEYEELTVFNKIEEKLLQQTFKIDVEFREPWGSAQVDLEGQNYLTDFEGSRTDFYSVELGGRINIRLVRGLSLNVGAGVEWIRDQLYLPAEKASDEEVLLRTKSLPTSYEYDVSLGLSYNFGSIYNNVVNPRFGF